MQICVAVGSYTCCARTRAAGCASTPATVVCRLNPWCDTRPVPHLAVGPTVGEGALLFYCHTAVRLTCGCQLRQPVLLQCVQH